MNRYEIGKLIKTLREEVNIEIKELAEKIGLADRSLKDIEEGHRAPGKKTLERIALAVGKPYNFFEPEHLLSNKKSIEQKISEVEICRMITLSTGHIERTTRDYLENPDRKELVVYDKTEYGYFIHLDSEYLEEILHNVPKDLLSVIRFAQRNNCEWLCLDCDGPFTDKLPTYEW
ncbi:helix-turn-helix domain-containing protein [Priestia megaterium]|nr:helix-turn-helix transcriptional regulator [Priestia megaterium]